MKKIWGIPVKDLKWQYEDGRSFDPDAVYPVVDLYANRVYGIDKQDEARVSVVHSYSPKSQPGAAFNFARTVWGDPRQWERPDISARVVSCLGAPACFCCVTADQSVMVGMAREWRMQSINDTDVQLRAAQIVDAGDPINEHIGDVHVMADLFEIVDGENNYKELARRAIALFGVPYDLATENIDDPAILALNMQLLGINHDQARHFANRQKSLRRDIGGTLARLMMN